MLQVLLRSNHIFLPRSVWENGLLGNKEFVSKKSRNVTYFKKLLEIKENPHLIVILNGDNLDNLVSEARKLSIPIIYFGSLTQELDGISYSVEGNFFKKKIKNFFQFLIYSILKKSKK